jgi:uncharacterized protein (DUF1684 family)
VSGADDRALAEWRQDVERWREARLFRLRSPDGWLSLVDRLILDEGETALPIGRVVREGDRVTFRAAPGVAVTLDGAPVGERVLRSDAGGDRPDRLLSGGRSYELVSRGPVLAIRVKDPQAPALRDFAGLAHFPLDPGWRVEARFQPYDRPRVTRHVYEVGAGEDRLAPGIARFDRAGAQLSLEPVIDGDGRRLFFVFGDATNRGGGSYPGGRFLYAELPRGTGPQTVVLDFNLAFNPPCAFTPFAICPAIAPENRLAVAVEAGERYQSDPQEPPGTLHLPA